MTKIAFEIKTCKDCPFVDIKPHYTSDSFEHASNWFCKKSRGKKIEGYIDWHEEKSVKIPKWCPIEIR